MSLFTLGVTCVLVICDLSLLVYIPFLYLLYRYRNSADMNSAFYRILLSTGVSDCLLIIVFACITQVTNNFMQLFTSKL